MTEYTPDKWVVIKIETDDREIYPLYKVFGSWSGGYLDGDRWRINSGVESVSEDGDFLLFHGFSGSVYRCHKEMYGMTAYSSGVLLNMIEKSEADAVILPEDSDWLGLDGISNE